MFARVCLFAVICTLPALADDSDRAKLAGRWQQADVAKDAGEVWVLETKDTDLHLTELRNGEKVAEFNCNTMGKECKVKDSGKSATVSFWFNGNSLVEMETKGPEVVKRRFTPAGQADALQVETIPIVPEGKSEVVRFSRAPESASAK